MNTIKLKELLDILYIKRWLLDWGIDCRYGKDAKSYVVEFQVPVDWSEKYKRMFYSNLSVMKKINYFMMSTPKQSQSEASKLYKEQQ